MKITQVEAFTVKLAEAAPGDLRFNSLGLTRIKTDEGITGYGFRTTNEDTLINKVRPQLIGANPLDIMEHLHSGALAGCETVENALWDIAGKAAGLPVRNLLGSASERIPYSLTCVWPGNTDQSHLSIEEQAQ